VSARIGCAGKCLTVAAAHEHRPCSVVAAATPVREDGVHANDDVHGGTGADQGQRDSGDTQVSVDHSTAC
jgi:hypothetical protein